MPAASEFLRKRLHLPGSALPAFVCRGCGQEFTDREESQFIRHASNCAQNEADRVRRHEELADPMLNPWDPEFAEWALRNGRVR